MTWTEALEIVIAQSRHEHYRVLCGDDHRHRDIWRARMVAMVTGEPIAEAPSPQPDINTGIGWVPPMGGCGGCGQ